MEQSSSRVSNGTQIVKKFPKFCGTRRFITACIISHYLFLFGAWLSLYSELLAPRSTPKLEQHPLLCVRDCLFYTFTATLYIGGRSSTRNMRSRYTVVTGNNLRGDADKSLSRPGRKQTTATKLGIYSTYFPRSSIHFLARCGIVPRKPLKKKFRTLSV
jgi:hypothetical protein